MVWIQRGAVWTVWSSTTQRSTTHPPPRLVATTTLRAPEGRMRSAMRPPCGAGRRTRPLRSSPLPRRSAGRGAERRACVNRDETIRGLAKDDEAERVIARGDDRARLRRSDSVGLGWAGVATSPLA